MFFIAISITTFFVDGLQWSVPAFVIFLALVSIIYWRRRPAKGPGQELIKRELKMIDDSEEVYSSLRQTFKGDLLCPRDDGYEEARLVWNGMVARKPGLIARCADVGDIQSAIRIASALGIVTAVRCGGHSLAGFSTCEGGLVIDLSRMRQVTVDPAARRARFAGGCLLGSIDNATQKEGLVFPSGVVSHTGASGLVLGGGTGWLTRRFRIILRQC